MAYSTVSQVSYILFGLATMQPVAFVGAIMHVIFHSLVKDTLFLSAGAIIMKTGRTQVKELAGIGKKMPVTMWCFTLVSVTLIGIPPTSAFVSKWYLCVGALDSAIPIIRWLGPCVLLVSALLTAGYLLTVAIHAFFDEDALDYTDPGLGMMIPMLIMTVLAVVLGIFNNELITYIEEITRELFL